MNLFGDTDANLPPGSTAAASDQVRFAELQIGEFATLGNDVPEQDFQQMRGFNIALHVRTAAGARRIFTALADGGKLKLHSAKWRGHLRLASLPTDSGHLG